MKYKTVDLSGGYSNQIFAEMARGEQVLKDTSLGNRRTPVAILAPSMPVSARQNIDLRFRRSRFALERRAKTFASFRAATPSHADPPPQVLEQKRKA